MKILKSARLVRYHNLNFIPLYLKRRRMSYTLCQFVSWVYGNKGCPLTEMMNPVNRKCMDAKQLGQRLKKVREMFGLSQLYVAEKLGVTQGHISRLENGKGKPDLLISTLNFYRQYISLDRLLNEKMSILECIQEELASPMSDLMKNRAVLVRELVNRLFEVFRDEQNAQIDEIIKVFNLKMDALDDVE